MVEQNNTPESPYPGPAEPGSEDDAYPDTEGGQSQEQGNVGVEPVDDAEEPTPGNSI